MYAVYWPGQNRGKATKGFSCEVVVAEQIANDFGCCKMYPLSVGGCHNSLTDSASRDYEKSRNRGLAHQ